MGGVKLERVHFRGFEVLSDNFNISAGIIIPAGCRTLATSGHVGLNNKGELEEELERQMDAAFENVEKTILAAALSLSKEEAWKSVYQITTYHKGGLGENVIKAMFDVARQRMGQHSPGWTAVGVEELAFGKFEIAVFAAIP